MRDIKCSPEAREKCPFDHPCDSEEKAYFEEGSPCDEFNKALIPSPPPTNAGRIRSMSDEELYILAKKQIGCGFDFFPCGVVCDGKCESFDDETCKAKIMDWLKQPYKEEPHE